MPVLTNEERMQVSAAWQKLMSVRRQAININKHEVLAAVGHVDDWVELEATSFNQTFLGADLTPGQKLRLLERVVRARRAREPDGGNTNGQ